MISLQSYVISLLCSLITVADVPGMEKSPQADTVKKFDRAESAVQSGPSQRVFQGK